MKLRKPLHPNSFLGNQEMYPCQISVEYESKHGKSTFVITIAGILMLDPSYPTPFYKVEFQDVPGEAIIEPVYSFTRILSKAQFA